MDLEWGIDVEGQVDAADQFKVLIQEIKGLQTAIDLDTQVVIGVVDGDRVYVLDDVHFFDLWTLVEF